jgi:hypothetical protein
MDRRTAGNLGSPRTNDVSDPSNDVQLFSARAFSRTDKQRGVICDYRVIISVVTSDMMNDHLLRHGGAHREGDAVKARHAFPGALGTVKRWRLPEYMTGASFLHE